MTTKPDLNRVWAEGAPGANVEDPDVTSPGKFDAGWTAEIPPFENFNFLQKLFTQALAHGNQFGIMQWDTDTEYPINGWARSTVDGAVYISLTATNQGNEPSVSGSDWKVLTIDTISGIETTVVSATDATWAPRADTKSIKFTVIGAGGGGGGTDGQGAGTAANSGSGGGSGTSILRTNTIAATYNITIGAGGAGGVAGNNNGSAGTNSSVVAAGVNVIGGGGSGGIGMLGSAVGVVNGGAGGTSSGGNINIRGSDGSAGGARGEAAITQPFGGVSTQGGQTINAGGTNGSSGIEKGSGGTGSLSQGTTGNLSGGDGADGVVIIEEFF